jgi:hypothetical protein
MSALQCVRPLYRNHCACHLRRTIYRLCAISTLQPAKKSKPRNGAGEIFVRAVGEIGRETVSVANYPTRAPWKPRQLARFGNPRQDYIVSLRISQSG